MKKNVLLRMVLMMSVICMLLPNFVFAQDMLYTEETDVMQALANNTAGQSFYIGEAGFNELLAADALNVEPRWTNVYSLLYEIQFYDGVGYADVTVDCYDGATVVVDVTMYRYSKGIMHFVDSWNNDDLLGYSAAMFYEPFDYIGGETYVMYVDIEATLNGYTETVSKTRTKVAPQGNP